jgi:hypothetical protein
MKGEKDRNGIQRLDPERYKSWITGLTGELPQPRKKRKNWFEREVAAWKRFNEQQERKQL